MAEGGFKGLIIGFILVGLFIFGMLTFAVSIANDYGRDSSEITNGVVDLDTVESYLDTIHPDAENREEQFKKTGLFSTDGSDIMTGIWDVATGLGTMIVTPFSIVGNILYNIFNVPFVVILVLLGILILILTFAVWRLIKSGE